MHKSFKTAETDYGKVRYIDPGPKDGRAIQFSTGGGTGFKSVYAFDWLVKEGFRVISINRPGYFDLDVDIVDDIEGHADIYHEVIRILGIDEVNVFGVAMGGLSALYYAQNYPTKSLALWSAVIGTNPLQKVFESQHAFRRRTYFNNTMPIVDAHHIIIDLSAR